jgi:tetratricopeptide (TPR) repeat protein
VVASVREVLIAQRHLEDQIGSDRMLPGIRVELDVVEQLTRQARGRVRTAMLTLATEYHGIVGRMYDYTGDQRAALYHDARAMQAAREVDDPNLLALVFGLKAHLAWAVGDAPGTVALAQAGQRDAHRLSPAVAGALAQMQARGHAMHNEDADAQRLTDRTQRLTAQAHEHPQDEPWWAYTQTPARVLFQRGLACRELGRHHEARDHFDQARAALPISFRRDHGRWAASFALASAHHGDLTTALTAGWQALGIALDTGSIYTIADLRNMHRVLDRQRADPDLLDEFDEALRELTEPAARR